MLAICASRFHVIRYEQEHLDEVLEIQEQAIEERPLLDAYSSALAFSYIELDQTEKARALLGAVAPADDFEVASTISARSELCTLTEVAARLGDQDAAAILYEQGLLPWRDQLCYSGDAVRDDRAFPRPRGDVHRAL